MTGWGWFFFGAFVVLGWWLWRWLARVLDAAGGDHWGPGLRRLDGLNRLFCRGYHRLRYEPLRLPSQGGAVIVANHISGLDPLLLCAATWRPLRFLVAREQYQRPLFLGLFRLIGCIPVDRDRRPERAFRVALKALRSGEVIVVFPHGKIHLDSHAPRPLKAGAIRLAQLAEVPLVPVRVEGVRGEGHVLPALFLPSRALLRSFDPVICDGVHKDECLRQVDRAISINPHH